MVVERVETGVPGLDRLIAGGLLTGSTTLVRGAPGIGKTTLALQFLVGGAVRFAQPGVFVTFEEFPEDLYRDASSFGWNIRELEAAGKLRVVFTSPEVLLDELRERDSPFLREIAAMKARRVVLDSATHYREITRDDIELRNTYRTLLGALKRERLTTILTSEDFHLFGHQDEQPDGLAFLVDSIILLRYVEIESGIRRAMVVLKQRGSAHDQDIRQYRIGSSGIEIEAPFKGREGIMSGTSRRTLAQRAVETFG